MIVREIREHQGLSVRELANKSKLSIGLISQIENGTRTITPDTSKSLAAALEIPESILFNDTKRKLQQILNDFDIDQQMDLFKTLSDEVMKKDFRMFTGEIKSKTPEKQSLENFEQKKTYNVKPYLGNLISNKNGPAYRAHSYHTKVPPEAIKILINHYTKPGDTVLDSFCGSGMTGVACRETGRNIVLNDLSPAAIHISSGYLNRPDLNELKTIGKEVLENLNNFCKWLYQTKENPNGGVANYFIWSDVFTCPNCGVNQEYFWMTYEFDETKMSFSQKKIQKCTKCDSIFSKNTWKYYAEQIVAVNERVGTSKKLYTRIASIKDTKHNDWVSKIKNPFWIPNNQFNKSYEMWRKSHDSLGINKVADFFSKRNLLALAYLNDLIRSLSISMEVKTALLFAFTACVNRASKRYQFNHKRPTNVMTGTLYIASARYEWNVFDLFKRKFSDITNYYEWINKCDQTNNFSYKLKLGSASDLSQFVPDSSVDFAFIDPPFGSNIYYSDCSLLWEGWINNLTDRNEEAVVSSKDPDRSIQRYEKIIKLSLKEIFRVLKPGRYCVVEFANTNPIIWSSIYNSILSSGFNLISAGELSKGQKSFKGLKDKDEFISTKDAILTLQKPCNSESISSSKHVGNKLINTSEFVNDFISKFQDSSTYSEADLYSKFLTLLMTKNIDPATVSFNEFKLAFESIRHHNSKKTQFEIYKNTNFLETNFLQKSTLTDTNIELPKIPKNPKASIFYGTHSYPTKIPPEYIAQYLAEETKPDDVILDPFCGSGMTGVAARIMGRNAIISDIGVLATHIATNQLRECDAEKLGQVSKSILKTLRKEEINPYLVKDSNNESIEIKFLIWSESYQCAECKTENFYWDICIDPIDKSLKKNGKCNKCQNDVVKNSKKTLRSLPSFMAYTTTKSKQYVEKVLSIKEREKFGSYKSNQKLKIIDHFKINKNREMYIRSALHLRSIENVSDFYTSRNLCALGLLYARIASVNDLRIRSALMFAFTNTAWHGTKMRRFNNKGGHRPLTGTLYIPQLISEGNVFDTFERKITSLQKYYNHIDKVFHNTRVTIQQNDAANLKSINDNSIDYVFTDPPFGANIFYADCNIVGEAWLGNLTNPDIEAVQNKSLKIINGGKSPADYIEIMRKAFGEIGRTLKKGKKAHIVFNNTDGTIWANLIDAAESSGLKLIGARSLDKIQKSMKGYKSSNGLENVSVTDLVLEFRNDKIIRKEKKEMATISQILKHFETFNFENQNFDKRFSDASFFSDFLAECHIKGISTAGITYGQIKDLIKMKNK